MKRLRAKLDLVSHPNWEIKTIRNVGYKFEVLEWKTKFTKKEFYLFMKLYYWIYQEEKLLKELENNEKIWKYDDIKKLLNNYKIDWWKYIDWEKMLLDKEKLEIIISKKEISRVVGIKKSNVHYFKDKIAIKEDSYLSRESFYLNGESFKREDLLKNILRVVLNETDYYKC